MARQIKLPDRLENSQDTPSVIKATFDVIAEKGLGKTSLSLVAKRLQVPAKDLYKNYGSVQGVIDLFLTQVDQAMLDYISPETASKRDTYFDMLMSRFDKLQEHRVGVQRWLKDMAKHPILLASVLKRWEKSLSLMLDIAQDSPVFPLKKIGLAGIYGLALREWIQDESPDMEKTMAIIDKSLGRADYLVARFMTKSSKMNTTV